MRKTFLGVCTILAALPVVGAAALTGCAKQAAVQEVPELIEAVGVDMDKAEVIRMDLKGIVSYPAQIVPRIEEIAFLSSGTIEDLKVSVGDHVKKGQLLATLSGTSGKAKSLQEEIKNQKAANEDVNKQSRYDLDVLEENKKALQKQLRGAKDSRMKKGLKQQIAEAEEDIKIGEERLKQQKELQQLELRQKEAELAEAKTSTKNSKLYSPIQGEVVATSGGTGYMVQGGNTAVQVANMQAPRIKTTYVSGTKLAKASRYVALVEGKEYEVEVEEQELDREDVERNIYPENTWFDFVNKNVSVDVGGSATIDLYTDAVEGALVVPYNAVFGSGEEKYVYIVEGDAKIKTAVTTGTETDAYVQITNGVKEGDVVYVED